MAEIVKLFCSGMSIASLVSETWTPDKGLLKQSGDWQKRLKDKKIIKLRNKEATMITINFLRPFYSMMDLMLNDIELLPHFEDIPTNQKERDDCYVMEMAVPGMKRGNLSLKVRDGVLRLRIHKGHRYHWPWQKNRVYIRCERQIPLPDSVSVRKIKARVSDGVLTITLPKKESYVTRTGNQPIQIQVA